MPESEASPAETKPAPAGHDDEIRILMARALGIEEPEQVISITVTAYPKQPLHVLVEMIPSYKRACDVIELLGRMHYKEREGI